MNSLNCVKVIKRQRLNVVIELMFVLFFVQKNTFFCLFVQLWLWRTLYESWILLSLNSRRTQYIPIQTLKFYFLNSFFAFILSLRSFVHTHTYWLVKNGCERALNEFVVVFFFIFFLQMRKKLCLSSGDWRTKMTLRRSICI